MAIVRNTLHPVPKTRRVTIGLVSPAGWRSAGAVEVVTRWITSIGDDGSWSIDLPPQASYVVPETWYQVSEPGATHAIVVPDSPGPHQLYALLVDPAPSSSGWQVTPRMSQLRDATALAAATGGQVPTWDDDAGEWIPTSGGGSGGVTDHGLLSGLADDDHAQYLTAARGDARYPPQARLVSAGTGLTGGGSLAADRTLAVAYGTTAGTAIQGNDPSRTDARTPLAHAATHQGGVDPITPAGIGAATTGHTHTGVYELSGAVDAHAAAGDPHPVYLTSAEANAAYAATGHTHSPKVTVSAEGSPPASPAVGDVWIVT